MKKFLWVLILIPILGLGQRKTRKQKAAEAKANIELTDHLRKHIQYLSDDKLEGRRAGSPGELLAMQYITAQYRAMDIEPAGSEGYIQEFDIDEGKKADPALTFLKVNGKNLTLTEDFFPLAFSAMQPAAGDAAVSLHEAAQPWFVDVKDILEENQSNPHFDMEDWIRKESERSAVKKASAIILYNSSSLTDNIAFNKNDTSAAVAIPVLYLTAEGYKKYCGDPVATMHVELQVSLSRHVRRARNIIGFIDNHAATTVILGAHYDHLGYGEDHNALDTGHVVHNGADDNASGTAAVIELARMLRQFAPQGNNYLFIHFSGEELGLLGSKYWLEHPTKAIRVNYMINMDMIGRYDTSRKLIVGGYGTSPAWGELFRTTTDRNMVLKFDSTGAGPSDHEAFYRKNIPVLFFFTGSHTDYHKATDDWQKINYEGEREIVQYIYRLIAALDGKGKVGFARTTEPAAGRSTFKVSLGIMPDYSFTGTGVRVDAIIPARIAEKAGLQAGDILLQLGEYKFTDVMSYMKALGKFEKGDKTVVRLKRNGEEKTYNITW